VAVTETGINLEVGSTRLGASTDAWTEQLVSMGDYQFLAGVRAAWRGEDLVVKVVDLASPMMLTAQLRLEEDSLKGKLAVEQTFGGGLLATLDLARS